MRLLSVPFLLVLSVALLHGRVVGQSSLSLKHLPVVPEEGTLLSSPLTWQSSRQQEEKSVTLAIAYSLVLPGMGELYAGTFSTGKYFLITDVGLWLGYGGFQYYGSWLRSDARTFAAQYSGADFRGKDEQYEVHIGNFNSVEEYNEAKLRNREFDLVYDASSSYAWRWENEASRLQFKNQRIRSDEVFQGAKFVIGAIVLNRIISAIAAGRAAAAYNNQLDEETAWRLGADVSGSVLRPHGLVLKISKTF